MALPRLLSRRRNIYHIAINPGAAEKLIRIKYGAKNRAKLATG
jgi:hypothetical protein